MVSGIQIVIDGLWNTDHAALVTSLLHELADLVAGIHGVVSTVIEEIADIIFFEYLKKAIVIGGIIIRITTL